MISEASMLPPGTVDAQHDAFDRIVVASLAQQAHGGIRADRARRLIAIENLAGRDDDTETIAVDMQRLRRAHGAQIVPVRDALIACAPPRLRRRAPFSCSSTSCRDLISVTRSALERDGREIALLRLRERRRIRST